MCNAAVVACESAMCVYAGGGGRGPSTSVAMHVWHGSGDVVRCVVNAKFDLVASLS